MSNVKVLKLLSGQEIITKVVNETSTELVVDSPLSLQAMRTGAGADSISIGLVPFSWAGLPHNIALNKTHVLCIMDPEPQLETQYLAGLAGITVPQPGQSATPKLTLVE